PVSGKYRVLRGGAWNYDDGLARVSYRYWLGPAYLHNYFGFRCALSP
ncbi:MAG: SUMF1/EgtB/PvdO family nonheme iron enzyme, partial [Chloroflexi bacterium]|nr:SUMF1/EgtB/PvdO family nonheme iron enzyme [Chloroflexota bacterium]